MVTHQAELDNHERFNFGDNWTKFLSDFDDAGIKDSISSLQIMLGVENLAGKSFLDVGSGSGLSSLAAKFLGANVVSFDYDPKSVACTEALKDRFFKNDESWAIFEGSVLSDAFVRPLGKFDIVYSWGVLHHTGSMWQAISSATSMVKGGGIFLIAIYNKQRFASKYWLLVKKLYLRHKLLRPFLIFVHGLYPVLPSYLFRKFQRRKYPRGMSIWYDLLDWLGGYPFEVASPAEIVDFMKSKGFLLQKIITVSNNHGCNEYVFIQV
jgi:2-polyprenyl-6-hydroxyphenyl methylase/3-demethylubiquinone-9 3-methyltransferase